MARYSRQLTKIFEGDCPQNCAWTTLCLGIAFPKNSTKWPHFFHLKWSTKQGQRESSMANTPTVFPRPNRPYSFLNLGTTNEDPIALDNLRNIKPECKF